MGNGTGLLEALRIAAIHWRLQRADGKRLRQWLRGGKVALDDDAGLLSALLAKAVACRAEEVLIARRELKGLYDIETHPEFWNADCRNAYEAGIEGDRWRSPEGLTHIARYGGFSRFDEYYLIEGRVELVGGYRVDVLSGYLPVLREAIARPVRLAVAGEVWDTPGDDGACTISLGERACGVDVGNDGIALRIAYENDASRPTPRGAGSGIAR